MSAVTTQAIITQFKGQLHKLSHKSVQTRTEMSVNVYLPPHALKPSATVPVVVYLSGLTCTPQNATEKSFLQFFAAKFGFAVVFPDTSPRGAGVAGEDKDMDLGTGAGFYVDATQEPWSENYRMFSYIHTELPQVLREAFTALDLNNVSIMGHSMGGCGALTGFLKKPGQYKSVSAFAPVAYPLQSDWGRKCFGHYLGPDESTWHQYDPVYLIKTYSHPNQPQILIHQGAQDQFYGGSKQLQPHEFVDAATEAKYKGGVDLQIQDGDHSYFFISSYMEQHATHHAHFLNCTG